MITLSSVKNERSCMCSEHGRLPYVLSTLRYNTSTDSFAKEITTVKNFKATLGGVTYDFPEGSEFHQVAFDTLGEYVKTWMLNGKGYINYMDNLQNVRLTKEVICTSISCGINSVYTYSKVATEVLVAYTTKDNEVMILEQSGRFQTPKLLTKIAGVTPVIRVCGPTSSNRFLIRFFDKVKAI